MITRSKSMNPIEDHVMAIFPTSLSMNLMIVLRSLPAAQIVTMREPKMVELPGAKKTSRMKRDSYPMIYNQASRQ